ncbi:MAG: hypothetical protein ACPKM0_11975 [Pleomorphochaeta sp.]
MNFLPSKSKRIIFDACIFMVDIEEKNYSFTNIKTALLDACFSVL